MPKYTCNIYIKHQAETETQEVPFEHREACFYCKDGWALQWFAVIAQRAWGVPVLGDIQKLSIEIPVPGQQAQGGPAWTAQLDQTVDQKRYKTLRKLCESKS